MKQRPVAIIAEYLSHRPLGRVVGLKAIAEDDYALAIEDIRDGRVHVARTPKDLEPWLASFKQGRLLRPTKAFCDCCGDIHSDRDTDAELFELCAHCQAELTAFAFEQAAS